MAPWTSDIENSYYWFVFNRWLPFAVQMAIPAIIFPFQVAVKKDEEDRRKRSWFIFLELHTWILILAQLLEQGHTAYPAAVEGEKCTFYFVKLRAKLKVSDSTSIKEDRSWGETGHLCLIYSWLNKQHSVTLFSQWRCSGCPLFISYQLKPIPHFCLWIKHLIWIYFPSSTPNQ